MIRAVRAATPEERARLGIDRWDEVWEGMLHVVPPPSLVHQRLSSKLSQFLGPLLEKRGIETLHETGVYRPGAGETDCRVPDLLFLAIGREPSLATDRGIEGGPLAVVEIRSPDDQTLDKLPFYASLGVVEVIVIEPDTRTVDIHRLVDGRYLRAGAYAATIDVRFATVTGPALRVECDGEAREI
jgi:Uma2 family endonuclease